MISKVRIFLFLLLVKIFGKNKWSLEVNPRLVMKYAISFLFYGQIVLNLEACMSSSHVYGTVAHEVIVTVDNSATCLKDNPTCNDGRTQPMTK
jgi:hypothetical protein